MTITKNPNCACVHKIYNDGHSHMSYLVLNIGIWFQHICPAVRPDTRAAIVRSDYGGCIGNIMKICMFTIPIIFSPSAASYGSNLKFPNIVNSFPKLKLNFRLTNCKWWRNPDYTVKTIVKSRITGNFLTRPKSD